MHTEDLDYVIGKETFQGYLAFEKEGPTKRPGILIAHAWMGLDEFAKEKARKLAELGYVAFAADLYGKGNRATTTEEATAFMLPLFLNRQLLQDRIKAGFNTLKQHPQVDPTRLGGIGYCFGGLSIIELFRSGVEIKGVVSFHAVLGASLQAHSAKTVPISPHVKGSILILHGYDDPLVQSENLLRIQEELNEAKVDWQLHVYGNTSHAFTNPDANDLKIGLKYNSLSDHRSWEEMKLFFNEILKS